MSSTAGQVVTETEKLEARIRDVQEQLDKLENSRLTAHQRRGRAIVSGDDRDETRKLLRLEKELSDEIELLREELTVLESQRPTAEQADAAAKLPDLIEQYKASVAVAVKKYKDAHQQCARFKETWGEALTAETHCAELRAAVLAVAAVAETKIELSGAPLLDRAPAVALYGELYAMTYQR